jgi:hypothetical protein
MKYFRSEVTGNQPVRCFSSRGQKQVKQIQVVKASDVRRKGQVSCITHSEVNAWHVPGAIVEL